jgi:hypothetical protein
MSEQLAERIRSILGPYNDDTESIQNLVSKIVLQLDELKAAQAGDGEALVGWRLSNDSLDYGITCYDEDAYRSYIGKGWKLVSMVYTHPQPAQVRFVASCSGLQYENPMACGEVSAVIVGEKRFDLPQPQVNQQLLDDIANMLKAAIGAIKLGQLHDAVNYLNAAIAAAQEGK